MQNTRTIKNIVFAILVAFICSLSACASRTGSLPEDAPTPFYNVLGISYKDFIEGIQEDYPIPPINMTVEEEKWAIVKKTGGALWVEYDANYESRAIIDFVRGFVQVEALVHGDSEEAKREAAHRLQRHIAVVNAHCLQNVGFDFLSGFEGKVEVTTMPNLPKEAFPQLYPVKEKPAPKQGAGQGVATQKPRAPRSYLEELQMRHIDPFAESGDTGASTTKSSQGQGLDEQDALSQYVAEGQGLEWSRKRDGVAKPTLTIIHIMGEAFIVPREKLHTLHTNNVVSIKMDLPDNYLQLAASQYKELIHAYSERFDLAPNLVYAVMHTESFFNPFARSYVPAYGLMQLVPSSGGLDAYQSIYHQKVKPSAEYLYDPKNNIELGTAYFSRVKNAYFKGIENERSAYIVSIAAYNTGAGNVSKALLGKSNLKEAVRIINTMTPQQVYDALQKYLPYKETKGYLNYIMRRTALYYGK